MRLRVAVSLLIGGASGVFCWYLLHHFNQGAADFQWVVRGAQHILARTNPYDTPLEQYPMTGILFGFPFVRMAPELAAAIFFGLSSALLAFGVTREGYTRLLVFMAYPYWAAILTAQWSPLILASAFLPILLPVTMAKPQVGFPVAVTHVTRRGVIACLAWLILSFLVMPQWPLLWWRQLGNYQHFFPLLVIPGPLLLLALVRYRERDAWLLLVAACMPQRWFFDAFILWAIPKSRRELVYTGALSWGAGIWRWYFMPSSFQDIGRWAVVFLYLPMLGILLARFWKSRRESRTPLPNS